MYRSVSYVQTLQVNLNVMQQKKRGIVYVILVMEIGLFVNSLETQFEFLLSCRIKEQLGLSSSMRLIMRI